MKVWIDRVACYECGDILSVPRDRIQGNMAAAVCVKPDCISKGREILIPVEMKWGRILMVGEFD